MVRTVRCRNGQDLGRLNAVVGGATFKVRANAFLAAWSLSQALAAAAEVDGAWHPTGFVIYETAHTFEGMPV